mmetsp:Transcript_52805/g.158066  ORF Transcript_52805/g.158066 Transcript_52805/m.158066 type:complete len:89 (+) Transcript_52805:101-367(+)
MQIRAHQLERVDVHASVREDDFDGADLPRLGDTKGIRVSQIEINERERYILGPQKCTGYLLTHPAEKSAKGQTFGFLKSSGSSGTAAA